MSEGTSGLVSNYKIPTYSFFVPGRSLNPGDGMMLASKIIEEDPAGLILENRLDRDNISRSGANVFYPQPGNTNTYDIGNYGVQYWVQAGTGVDGNVNWRYGRLPNNAAFVRNGTVTGPISDIYNFTNPGVYIYCIIMYFQFLFLLACLVYLKQ